MYKKIYSLMAALLLTTILLTGCETAPPISISDPASSTKVTPGTPVSDNKASTSTSQDSPEGSTEINEVDDGNNSQSQQAGSRDSAPLCLVPEATGAKTDGNDLVTIDYSNFTEGYIMINYLGSSPKVKFQITGPNQVTYTYNLKNGYDAFPIVSGDGDYSVSVCENISGNKYSIVFAATYTFTGVDEFKPYLYPNQYVNFDASKETIAKGQELSKPCNTDLEVVTNVYNYMISKITYDYEKAETVASGYISDVDEILRSGTGICLDYAAVMTSMLRSQRIPTRLEVGYVGVDMVYHAWISVYIEEIGWLNGIIQFNGNEWELVDPTFGASTDEKKLKDYIGDGTNYSVKYIY